MNILTIIIFLITLSSLVLKLFVIKKLKEQASATDKFNKSVSELSQSLDKVHKRIDQIFVVDIPSPNEATNKDPNEIDLSETDSHQIPKDVKLDVEGGDSQTPPGFEVKKN